MEWYAPPSRREDVLDSARLCGLAAVHLWAATATACSSAGLSPPDLELLAVVSGWLGQA